MMLGFTFHRVCSVKLNIFDWRGGVGVLVNLLGTWCLSEKFDAKFAKIVAADD